MVKERRIKRFSDNTGKMLGAVALLMAAVLTALLCDGLIRLSKECRTMSLKQYPVSQEETVDRVVYTDHLYYDHGFVLRIPPNTADPSVPVRNLLDDIPRYVSADLFNGIVAYSALICTVAALFLYGFSPDDPKKHLLLILLTPPVFAALIAGLTWGVSALCGLRLPFPSGVGSDFFFIGLLSLMAGGCAVGLLLRAAPHKKIAAVILIPVVLFLLMWANKEEKTLFVPASTSTETVSMVESTGAEERAAAGREAAKDDKALSTVLTALFPFSGCDLWLVYDDALEISRWGVTLIMVKNAVWFALATVLMTRSRRKLRRRRAAP